MTNPPVVPYRRRKLPKRFKRPEVSIHGGPPRSWHTVPWTAVQPGDTVAGVGTIWAISTTGDQTFIRHGSETDVQGSVAHATDRVFAFTASEPDE